MYVCMLCMYVMYVCMYGRSLVYIHTLYTVKGAPVVGTFLLSWIGPSSFYLILLFYIHFPGVHFPGVDLLPWGPHDPHLPPRAARPDPLAHHKRLSSSGIGMLFQPCSFQSKPMASIASSLLLSLALISRCTGVR